MARPLITPARCAVLLQQLARGTADLEPDEIRIVTQWALDEIADLKSELARRHIYSDTLHEVIQTMYDATKRGDKE